MAVTYATFKIRFPELASTTEAYYNAAYVAATNLISAANFGAKADEATHLLVAHYVTLAKRGGTSGQITSEKVGDLMRSYAQGGTKFMDTTLYGQMYQSLSNHTFFKVITI